MTNMDLNSKIYYYALEQDTISSILFLYLPRILLAVNSLFCLPACKMGLCQLQSHLGILHECTYQECTHKA